ncbi:MAG: hypothetical protein IJJ44_01130 [Solobacterium sp.]|nr:hypothetical protein [Solobacterium sp.]
MVEGNTWNDRCWGVDIRTGTGQNHLGIILMKIRSELRQEDILMIRGQTIHNRSRKYRHTYE